VGESRSENPDKDLSGVNTECFLSRENAPKKTECQFFFGFSDSVGKTEYLLLRSTVFHMTFHSLFVLEQHISRDHVEFPPRFATKIGNFFGFWFRLWRSHLHLQCHNASTNLPKIGFDFYGGLKNSCVASLSRCLTSHFSRPPYIRTRESV
jgi:hypothetical protein